MILRRWGSIYLDKYEEEDFKIRRGKPLYLSETRFNILEKIWISSAFPRFVALIEYPIKKILARALVKIENALDLCNLHQLGNDSVIIYKKKYFILLVFDCLCSKNPLFEKINIFFRRTNRLIFYVQINLAYLVSTRILTQLHF